MVNQGLPHTVSQPACSLNTSSGRHSGRLAKAIKQRRKSFSALFTAGFQVTTAVSCGMGRCAMPCSNDDNTTNDNVGWTIIHTDADDV